MWHDMLKQGVEGFIVAFIAFMWFRRTALWRFYHKILKESKLQSVTEPLNRKAWEKIWVIEWDLIGSLLEFEVAFLSFLIKSSQNSLWESDHSLSEGLVEDTKDIISTEKKEKTITDREEYSEYVLRDLFIRRFSFIGIPLFFESLLWTIKHKYPKGHSEETYTKPARNFIPKK